MLDGCVVAGARLRNGSAGHLAVCIRQYHARAATPVCSVVYHDAWRGVRHNVKKMSGAGRCCSSPAGGCLVFSRGELAACITAQFDGQLPQKQLATRADGWYSPCLNRKHYAIRSALSLPRHFHTGVGATICDPPKRRAAARSALNAEVALKLPLRE